MFQRGLTIAVVIVAASVVVVGDDARGCAAHATVRLVVEDAVDAALLVIEPPFAVGTAPNIAALVALQRAAHFADIVGAIDAGEAVAARLVVTYQDKTTGTSDRIGG